MNQAPLTIGVVVTLFSWPLVRVLAVVWPDPDYPEPNARRDVVDGVLFAGPLIGLVLIAAAFLAI